MENRANAVQCNTDARAVAFADFSPASDEKRLDIAPGDAGADGIGEYGFQSRPVFSTNSYIVSLSSISDNGGH